MPDVKEDDFFIFCVEPFVLIILAELIRFIF